MLIKVFVFPPPESGSGSNQLRKTEVVALSESECVDYWGSGNILEQQLCVKGYNNPNGAGACNVSITVLFIVRFNILPLVLRTIVSLFIVGS